MQTISRRYLFIMFVVWIFLEEEDKKKREEEKAQIETESEDKSKNHAIPKQIVAFRV